MNTHPLLEATTREDDDVIWAAELALVVVEGAKDEVGTPTKRNSIITVLESEVWNCPNNLYFIWNGMSERVQWSA